MTAAPNFAALPPEINSARMYTGAGAAPMLAAASAWQALAAELHATVLTYDVVLSVLTGEEWFGPAAASMAAAAAPYVAWMGTTAAQADQTATQAQAAAAAYEVAFAATVSPSTIAANRAQLATLVATTSWVRTLPRLQQPRCSTSRCGRRMPPPCTATPDHRRLPQNCAHSLSQSRSRTPAGWRCRRLRSARPSECRRAASTARCPN